MHNDAVYDQEQDDGQDDQDEDSHGLTGPSGLVVDTMAPMTLSPGLHYDDNLYDANGAPVDSSADYENRSGMGDYDTRQVCTRFAWS